MRNTPKVYFISGTSGVGKSSVMKQLQNLLLPDLYDIRDFDERGVPDNAGPEWHKNETMHWLELAGDNAKSGKSTIICGVVEPEKFDEIHNKDRNLPVQLFFLHASPDVLRKRLLGRYVTSDSRADILRASGRAYDKYVDDMVRDSSGLLRAFEKAGLPIVDTDNKTVEDVAEEIIRQL